MPNRILEVVKRDQRIIQINTSETALPTMDVADNINYDNTESGLDATNIQNAIDELAATKEELFTQAVRDVLDQTTAPFTTELEEKLDGFLDPENYLTINTIISGEEGGLIVGGGSLSGDVRNLNVDLSRLVIDGLGNAAPEDSIPIIRADGSQTRLEAKNFLTVSGFKFMGYVKSVPADPSRMELCDRHRIGIGEFIDKKTPPPLNPERPNRDGYAYEVLLSTVENQTGHISTIQGDDGFDPVVMFSHDILIWTSDTNVSDTGIWGLVESGARVQNFNGRNGAITPLLGDYHANQIYYDETNTSTVKLELDVKARLDGQNLFIGNQLFDEGLVLQPMAEFPDGVAGQIVCVPDVDGVETIYSFINGEWSAIGAGGAGGGGDPALVQLITDLQAELEAEKLKIVALEERVDELEAGNTLPEGKTVVHNFSSITAPTMADSVPGDTWIDTVNSIYHVRIGEAWVPIMTGELPQQYAEDIEINKPLPIEEMANVPL